MSNIFFAWELGGGLGHMMQMAPLARELVRRGHRVHAALRDLAGAQLAFAESDVCYLQAPFAQPKAAGVAGRGADSFDRTLNFAHVLANVGWGDVQALFPVACGWRNLLSAVRPDAVVFDHAPTALLASRGLPMKRVVIGSGFCVPPDASPFPLFRPELAKEVDADRLAKDERRVLSRANTILRQWGEKPLDRLGQLYGEADETLLLTLPELDHYPPSLRGGGARYWGAVGNAECRMMNAEWEAKDTAAPLPDSAFCIHHSAFRVFAYLKNFPALPELLAALRDGGHPTIVVCDGVPRELREKFATCPTIRFEDRPLDLRHVAERCDLAVLNAGHGATAAMLLAGVPALLVPIHLEQGLLARAAVRNTNGAAVEANPKDGPRLVAAFNEMLASLPPRKAAARAFAARHASQDPHKQVEQMAERVEELLAAKQSRPRLPTRRTSSIAFGVEAAPRHGNKSRERRGA
jgi:hypothetical protein